MADMGKTYSEETIDYSIDLRNFGEIPDAHGFGKIASLLGNTMEIKLLVKGRFVTGSTFSTNGFELALLQGSWLLD
jgi:hypothetical protein